ncbi:hypothetical protein GWK47_047265 [Chionoecetes opilio]|uniref:Tesmin/TSO1-like CXC domain-containing protein n=1 Tax=Chionoecetes opilio TaxID=41210 RepID=A0A8J5CWP6_CHIOP|nr:hypothetical protein GWK47_047265 [Chionoecetes opilio]
MLQNFTCTLYGCKLKDPTVNDLRYMLFSSRKGELESFQLPPCSDCSFKFKHSQRANYQTAIWKRSIIRETNIPSPGGYGWTLDAQSIYIDWMDSCPELTPVGARPPAPECVLELLSCKCKRVCKARDCPYMINGLRCSEMCQLQGCSNQAMDAASDDTDDNTSHSESLDEDEDDY